MAVFDFWAFKPNVRTGLDCGALNDSHQSTVNLANLQAQEGTSAYETPEKQNFLSCPLKKKTTNIQEAANEDWAVPTKTIKMHSLERIYTHARKRISSISPDEEPSTDTARTISPAPNLQSGFNIIYTFPRLLVLKLTPLLWN